MQWRTVLCIVFVGLLQAGVSMGADCAVLAGDSIFRRECERSQKGLAPSGELRAQVIRGPGSSREEGGLSRSWAAEGGPPFRKQGDEPLITVFLVSGSTIRADKTWVKGDRLFYFSRGFKGSVPLLEVNRLEDVRDKLRPGNGR